VAAPLTGKAGRLLIGGRVAAELSAWECHVTGPDQVSVNGRIRQADAFWIEDPGPFRLELPWGDQVQTWREAVILEHDETHIALEARGRQPHA
jgi:hypothetical protein